MKVKPWPFGYNTFLRLRPVSDGTICRINEAKRNQTSVTHWQKEKGQDVYDA